MRSYGQYCGLARALDVVGDRWNLLIVRELLVGPARYRELQAGLPGVATNLLAARLRDLEAAGVLARHVADDANAVVYALTPWGEALREPIAGLIRWSTPLMARGAQGDHFRAEWLVPALSALLADRAPRRSATVGVAVDGGADGALVRVRATPEGIAVSRDDGGGLDAVVRGDPSLVLGMAAGGLTVDDALGSLDVDGDADAVRAAFAR